MLTVPEDVIAHLLARYRKATRPDIDAIISNAERWLRDNVHPQYLLPGQMPVEFLAIPILKIHVVYGYKTSRVAGTFGAWDLIAPYRKIPA